MVMNYKLTLSVYYQLILNTFEQCQYVLYFTDAMNPSEVAVGLSLPKMTNRKWSIHGACATTGDGIFESMKEMADMLQENEKLKEY
jgi:hypothetical protein